MENNKKELDITDFHRLSIKYDNIEILGASITSKKPQNHEEMISLIRELLDSMRAPDVKDIEVLGERI